MRSLQAQPTWWDLKAWPDVRPCLSDDHCDERNFVWKEVLQPIVQLLPATYMAEAWL